MSDVARDEVLERMRRDVGKESEPGDWFVIDQSIVNAYVELTGETGWIHTDVDRAATSKFGGTIVPGNLGIAILPRLSRRTSMYSIYPRLYSLNQGWDKIRFLGPLATGSRVRARSRLLSVEDRADGSLRVAVEFWLEVENRERPWVVGTKVGRFFF